MPHEPNGSCSLTFRTFLIAALQGGDPFVFDFFAQFLPLLACEKRCLQSCKAGRHDGDAISMTEGWQPHLHITRVVCPFNALIEHGSTFPLCLGFGVVALEGHVSVTATATWNRCFLRGFSEHRLQVLFLANTALVLVVGGNDGHLRFLDLSANLAERVTIMFRTGNGLGRN